MNLSRLLVLVFVLVGEMGCAMRPMAPVPLSVPPQRVATSQLSLMPLDEPGWLRVPTGPAHLVLLKRGGTIDETLVIEAKPVELPASMGFDGMVRELQRSQPPEASPRFNIRAKEMVDERRQGHQCFRAYTLSDDTQALKRSTGATGTMAFEVQTRICLLPGQATKAVTVAYSHRYVAGQSDPKFREKAAAVLDSMRWTDH